MQLQLGFLLSVIALCNAAALPAVQDSNVPRRLPLHEHIAASDYSLNTELKRRATVEGSVSVSLRLVDSGYCGHISIGSQDKSIVTLFDLNTSRLSALASNLTTNIEGTYDPSLSDTAVDLSETFEVTISSTTLTGVVYEDSVVVGGTSPHKFDLISRAESFKTIIRVYSRDSG